MSTLGQYGDTEFGSAEYGGIVSVSESGSLTASSTTTSDDTAISLSDAILTAGNKLYTVSSTNSVERTSNTYSSLNVLRHRSSTTESGSTSSTKSVTGSDHTVAITLTTPISSPVLAQTLGSTSYSTDVATSTHQHIPRVDDTTISFDQSTNTYTGRVRVLESSGASQSEETSLSIDGSFTAKVPTTASAFNTARATFSTLFVAVGDSLGSTSVQTISTGTSFDIPESSTGIETSEFIADTLYRADGYTNSVDHVDSIIGTGLYTPGDQSTSTESGHVSREKPVVGLEYNAFATDSPSIVKSSSMWSTSSTALRPKVTQTTGTIQNITGISEGYESASSLLPPLYRSGDQGIVTDSGSQIKGSSQFGTTHGYAEDGGLVERSYTVLGSDNVNILESPHISRPVRYTLFEESDIVESIKSVGSLNSTLIDRNKAFAELERITFSYDVDRIEYTAIASDTPLIDQGTTVDTDESTTSIGRATAIGNGIFSGDETSGAIGRIDTTLSEIYNIDEFTNSIDTVSQLSNSVYRTTDFALSTEDGSGSNTTVSTVESDHTKSIENADSGITHWVGGTDSSRSIEDGSLVHTNTPSSTESSVAIDNGRVQQYTGSAGTDATVSTEQGSTSGSPIQYASSYIHSVERSAAVFGTIQKAIVTSDGSVLELVSNTYGTVQRARELGPSAVVAKQVTSSATESVDYSAGTETGSVENEYIVELLNSRALSVETPDIDESVITDSVEYSGASEHGLVESIEETSLDSTTISVELPSRRLEINPLLYSDTALGTDNIETTFIPEPSLLYTAASTDSGSVCRSLATRGLSETSHNPIGFCMANSIGVETGESAFGTESISHTNRMLLRARITIPSLLRNISITNTLRDIIGLEQLRPRRVELHRDGDTNVNVENESRSVNIK